MAISASGKKELYKDDPAMNGKNKKLPVNYSVKNIIDSILSDNRTAVKYSEAGKKKLYAKCQAALTKNPGLKKILSASHIHSMPVDGADFFSRVGVLPPEIVVADERIKNMCALPYWTIYKDKKGAAYKRFDKCPGYGWLPGCPPRSPSVKEVQNILDRSTHFIVLQTRLLDERWETGWKFAVLRGLARDIERLFGKAAVTGRFGSGPCSACAAQYCLHSQPCKTPALKTTSLESMGICVDRLCSDLALVTNQNSWKLTWLRHFGFPQQAPGKWKYVEAISVSLPE